MFSSFTGGKIVSQVFHKSSNIKEVIKEIFNLFIFFYEEILTYKNIQEKVHKQIYA